MATWRDPTDDWMTRGARDAQTTDADWTLVDLPNIDGVVCKEIHPVTVGNGCLTEIWRAEWKLDELPVAQAFQRQLDPGGISGWHAHAHTTDRLFCARGRVRLSLYDGRKSSPTFGVAWQRVFGDQRPLLVVVPPGVWHAVGALGSCDALVINLVDRAYSYESPDHWRLPIDTPEIPVKLV